MNQFITFMSFSKEIALNYNISFIILFISLIAYAISRAREAWFKAKSIK